MLTNYFDGRNGRYLETQVLGSALGRLPSLETDAGHEETMTKRNHWND